jgi:hypothetical protein
MQGRQRRGGLGQVCLRPAPISEPTEQCCPQRRARACLLSLAAPGITAPPGAPDSLPSDEPRWLVTTRRPCVGRWRQLGMPRGGAADGEREELLLACSHIISTLADPGGAPLQPRLRMENGRG